MEMYSYVAIDAKGKQKKGSFESNDEAHVREYLKNEGLVAVEIKPQSAMDREINLNIGGGVKPRDLSVFCRQMNSILVAGVPVIEALTMLADQTENKNLASAVKRVQVAVQKGDTLADAMRDEPKIFPNIAAQMVEAGEASGSLEIAFERLAVQFEKDAKLKGLIKQAMIYPIVIIVVAVGVIAIMMMVVIPNFTSMFDDLGTELPAITKSVVAISDFMIARWYILLGGIVGVVFAIKFFLKTDFGSHFWAKCCLVLPLVNNLTIKSAAAKLARTLSTLLASGLPLLDAVEITAKTMSNLLVKEILLDAKTEVAKGVPLSQPLEVSGVFPPMVYQMTKIGEETGNTEAMLEKVADYFDEEVEAATKALTAVMEPLIIVILAVVVGTVVMAIMAPMMSMYSAIESA